MAVTTDGACQQRYWQLDPERELRLGSDGEYAEALRELFTKAVRCRLRTAFPIGSMLSGGMDSSSIACVAQKLLAEDGREPLFTFSALHDEVPESDERYFVHAVLAQGRYIARRLNLDATSPLVGLEQVLWHQDEAYRSGNLYTNLSLYGVAQEQGVRVILDGFDGDSTISHGLGLLAELAHARRWVELAREVIWYGHRTKTPWGPPLWAWLHRYGLRPATAKYRAVKQLSRLGRGLLRRTRKHAVASRNQHYVAILRPEFSRRIGLEQNSRVRTAPPRTDREIQYQRLTEPGMALTLETLDKCAGAFAIEIRFPFWFGTDAWWNSASLCRQSKSCTEDGRE
jgi:asparagine synthase (glutamine-hydrolysing)